MNRALWSLAALGLLAAATGAQVKQREVLDQDVERAIEEAKRFLYGLQREGGDWHAWDREVPTGTGHTSIALFALLEGDENPADPRIRKGVDWLVNAKTDNTYVIATRAMILSELVSRAGEEKSPFLKPLEEDLKFLLKNANVGAWGYHGPERTGDNSCSQFALLALWEADRVGMEVPLQVVRAAETTWRTRQRKDGGWPYPGQPDANTQPTASMTAAGLASLYVCQDMLSVGVAAYPHQKTLDDAWKYLAANLKDDFWKSGYLAFCVQRIGMASGEKFVGDMDWFATAAAKLAEPNPRGRRYEGQYGPIIQASFELIFLARSRLPMTFNKLSYGQEAAWNLYPRDVARFTDYMRRRFEGRMRWQVVKATDDVRMMLDSPILLVEGTGAPNFTKEEWDKLREYSLSGGMILMIPNGARGGAFSQSAQEALKTLYAEARELNGKHYELGKLPADHPVYNLRERIDNGPAIAPMYGVSDGSRLVALVCERDLALAWQMRTHDRNKVDFDLTKNIYFYATGLNRLRGRLRPVFVPPKGEAREQLKVAWLKHEGNWYTAPAALKYLSRKLAAENRVALDVTVGAPITAESLRGHRLAWLAGSEAFALKPDEIKALHGFLDSGGLLFVNAVGGSTAFARSARAMLDSVIEGRVTQFGSASNDSWLMNGKCGDYRGPIITRVQRSKAWQDFEKDVSGPMVTLYEENRQPVIVYVPYGIHDTLDGHTVHGAMSYMPATARDLAANIALMALADRPRPKPSATATAPAQSAPTSTSAAATAPSR